MDSVVMRLLVPVCNVLRRERETEIKELAEHNMQFHNELTSYQRRQLEVDIVLRKHTSYKLSPLYKKLEADIETFLETYLNRFIYLWEARCLAMKWSLVDGIYPVPAIYNNMNTTR